MGRLTMVPLRREVFRNAALAFAADRIHIILVGCSCRRLIVILVTVACMLDVLAACARNNPPPVRLGTYMGHLCEDLGPFERDWQRLGRILRRHGLDVKSRYDAQALSGILSAVILDSRHAVDDLGAVGAPDISNGHGLAAGIIATFDQIGASDAVWRSRLLAGKWRWPSAALEKKEPLGISLEGLVLVGRQIERLPHTRERREAMARSPVCRYVFGPVRVGE
jgi:hypothetical protein